MRQVSGHIGGRMASQVSRNESFMQHRCIAAGLAAICFSQPEMLSLNVLTVNTLPKIRHCRRTWSWVE